MADMPQEDDPDKTDLPPMGWLEGNTASAALQPPPKVHQIFLEAASFSMAFGYAAMTVSEGYVPDPHEDPKKLLELIMSSPPLPRASEPWPSELPQQIALIYKLAGELGSKMSEIELGWYLMLISIMPQTPRSIINAIINPRGSTNGGQQRHTVQVIAQAIFPDEKSDFRVFFGKLQAATDALQNKRNAAVHSIIKIGLHQGHSRIIVTGTTTPSKLPDLVPSKIRERLEECISEADRIIGAIQKYFHHVDTHELSTPTPICPRLDAGWSHPL